MKYRVLINREMIVEGDINSHENDSDHRYPNEEQRVFIGILFVCAFGMQQPI